ncbi:hypothetical protein FRC07_002993 [Ceratobasidium sp. 392]|nr:hypothetical protein FRC07_002993 [Ceratobasidium sp. 392]
MQHQGHAKLSAIMRLRHAFGAKELVKSSSLTSKFGRSITGTHDNARVLSTKLMALFSEVALRHLIPYYQRFDVWNPAVELHEDGFNELPAIVGNSLRPRPRRRIESGEVWSDLLPAGTRVLLEDGDIVLKYAGAVPKKSTIHFVRQAATPLFSPLTNVKTLDQLNLTRARSRLMSVESQTIPGLQPGPFSLPLAPALPRRALQPAPAHQPRALQPPPIQLPPSKYKSKLKISKEPQLPATEVRTEIADMGEVVAATRKIPATYSDEPMPPLSPDSQPASPPPTLVDPESPRRPHSTLANTVFAMNMMSSGSEMAVDLELQPSAKPSPKPSPQPLPNRLPVHLAEDACAPPAEAQVRGLGEGQLVLGRSVPTPKFDVNILTEVDRRLRIYIAQQILDTDTEAEIDALFIATLIQNVSLSPENLKLIRRVLAEM